jgi:hypothetical protein
MGRHLHCRTHREVREESEGIVKEQTELGKLAEPFGKHLGLLCSRAGVGPDWLWLAMEFTTEELEFLKRMLEQGDSFEDTPEMQDIHLRFVAVGEELAPGKHAQKIAGEL